MLRQRGAQPHPEQRVIVADEHALFHRSVLRGGSPAPGAGNGTKGTDTSSRVPPDAPGPIVQCPPSSLVRSSMDTKPSPPLPAPDWVRSPVPETVVLDGGP